KNMADVLWRTMGVYGLKDRVLAINCDNATSNDTLLEEIEMLCLENDIPFSAADARMRYLPHTIHLSTMEILMALGVVNKGTSSKSRDNYQDSVTAPVDREYDN
ncbi:hypothetical protein BD311DRAFT_632880, partial [Dichomitus squalens]